MRQWAVYALLSSLAASLLSLLLSSGVGRELMRLSCSFAYDLGNDDISRLLATLCKSGEDGVVTEEEAKAIIDRAIKAAGPDAAREFLEEDPENLERRAVEEVDFGVRRYEALYDDSPKIDAALRKQFPEFTEEQLCVLSQVERYMDGDAIGMRYVGMRVCDEE